MDTAFAIVFIPLFIISWYAFLAHCFFSPGFYARGMRTVSGEAEMPPLTLPVGTVFVTRTGKFKVLTPRCILFRHRLLFGGYQSALPLSCTLEWREEDATYSGRVSFEYLADDALGLVVIAVLAILLMTRQRDIGGGLALFGIMGVGAALIYGVSIPLEIRRAHRMVRECRDYLAGNTHA